MVSSSAHPAPAEYALPKRVAAPALIVIALVFFVAGLVAALSAHDEPLFVADGQVHGLLPYLVAGGSFLLAAASLLALVVLAGVAELVQVALAHLASRVEQPISEDVDQSG